jgi:hypothetical protein
MSPSNRMLRLALSRGRVAGVTLVTAVLVASSAGADPKFPDKLRADLKMPCTPGCAVCHLDASGGPGRLRMTTTGNPGFGMNLKNYGLTTSDLNSLELALKAAAADSPPPDIDGDGTPDLDELKKGDDPNDPTVGASVCSAGPEFGCVRVARQGPVDGVASVVGAAVLALGVAAFRRRRAG